MSDIRVQYFIPHSSKRSLLQQKICHCFFLFCEYIAVYFLCAGEQGTMWWGYKCAFILELGLATYHDQIRRCVCIQVFNLTLLICKGTPGVFSWPINSMLLHSDAEFGAKVLIECTNGKYSWSSDFNSFPDEGQFIFMAHRSRARCILTTHVAGRDYSMGSSL